MVSSCLIQLLIGIFSCLILCWMLQCYKFLYLPNFQHAKGFFIIYKWKVWYCIHNSSEIVLMVCTWSLELYIALWRLIFLTACLMSSTFLAVVLSFLIVSAFDEFSRFPKNFNNLFEDLRSYELCTLCDCCW